MRGQFYFIVVSVIFSASVQCTLAGSALQQRLVKSNLLPTSSCIEVANQTQSSVLCSATCLKSHEDIVVSSRHVVSTRCVCCRSLLTGTQFSDTEWITYRDDETLIVYSYCPIGYIIINHSPVTTCLRLELMTKNYSGAALGCHADGGNLIRIDSAEKYTIFLQFIASHVPPSVAEIWIQSFRDPNDLNMIWRFHDHTVMPEHCPLVTSDMPIETRLRFMIAEGICNDNTPTHFYNSVCEREATTISYL